MSDEDPLVTFSERAADLDLTICTGAGERITYESAAAAEALADRWYVVWTSTGAFLGHSLTERPGYSARLLEPYRLGGNGQALGKYLLASHPWTAVRLQATDLVDAFEEARSLRA